MPFADSLFVMVNLKNHPLLFSNRRLRKIERILVVISRLLAISLLASFLIACNLPGSREMNASTSTPENQGPVRGDGASSTPAQPASTLTPGAEGPDQAVPTPTIVLPAPHPWDGESRVTILVMGLDYADWESDDRAGPPRTDTMILLTVDPVSRTAGMLSIPRDLWVTMPGIQGYHKINTAHRFGELYELPGGGPGLAMRTVEQLFGVPINYYARIDFYAFEDFIDELGGIEVDVPQEIEVDPIGPGNTVVLEPGRQLIDGPTALAYARNRNTSDGDFDRSRRQQQVILAIRDRVLRLDMLPLLVYKAPDLYRNLNQGVQTNLTLEQAIRLAWLAREIRPEDIRHAVIGNSEVVYDTAPDGQTIFVPIPERIQALRDEIFSSSMPGLSQGMTTEELIAAENTRISIVNESGDEALGELTADYLAELGLNVIQVEESDNSRGKTRLVDQVGDPYTLRYLINLLHVAPSEIYLQYDLEAGADLVIYLGADWASDNPLQ